MPWPEYVEALLKETTITVVVQVNGKVRDKLDVPANISNANLEQRARANAKVQEFIAGKTIKKVIVVPGKLVNIVAV